MPRRTSVGQLMVNRVLPEDMRDYNRVLDKKAVMDLMRELAQKHPDDYREVSHALSKIGHQAAYTTGGNSFGLRHMRMAKSAKLARDRLKVQLRVVMDDDELTDDQRDEKIVRLVGRLGEKQQDEIFNESIEEDNPLAMQVLSGSKGSKMNLASLRGSDLLYTDHKGKVLPIPVLRSYSQGLRPVEYWAGAYGARKGVIDLKFATQEAGFLSKQLNQIAHRAMVTALDADKEPETLRGLPVETDDPDNEGALLAYSVAGYPRNTVLTPKILADMRRRKIQRLLVRSPAVFGTPDGGVYARDAGIREFGRLPVQGENVGLTAAQALSEPLTQAQISSKHSGGVVGAGAESAISGFDRINQLIQTPKSFKGGAAHSRKDGIVQFVEDAPAGGKFVTIDSEKHYVGDGFDLKVKKGDKIEAGDVISEGIPNPSTIVEHKGIGEGRRYFVKVFRQAFEDAGIARKTGTRRNIELLARGLINHVRLTDEVGDFAPDDVVPYSMLEHRYKPRPDSASMIPKRALGQYLEKPYLHYSIGTRVKQSMLRDFKDFGIREVVAHSEAPPFQPEMIRGMATLQHDPDWMTRMFGSGLKKSLLQGVHRGGHSTTQSTSFVPALANPVTFGQTGKVVTPQRNDDQDRMQKRFKMASDEQFMPKTDDIPTLLALAQRHGVKGADLAAIDAEWQERESGQPQGMSKENYRKVWLQSLIGRRLHAIDLANSFNQQGDGALSVDDAEVFLGEQSKEDSTQRVAQAERDRHDPVAHQAKALSNREQSVLQYNKAIARRRRSQQFQPAGLGSPAKYGVGAEPYGHLPGSRNDPYTSEGIYPTHEAWQMMAESQGKEQPWLSDDLKKRLGMSIMTYGLSDLAERQYAPGGDIPAGQDLQRLMLPVKQPPVPTVGESIWNAPGRVGSRVYNTVVESDSTRAEGPEAQIARYNHYIAQGKVPHQEITDLAFAAMQELGYNLEPFWSEGYKGDTKFESREPPMGVDQQYVQPAKPKMVDPNTIKSNYTNIHGGPNGELLGTDLSGQEIVIDPVTGGPIGGGPPMTLAQAGALQNRTAYQPMQGLLPYAQMMHRMMPGSVEQVMQQAGPAMPLAWGALFDPGAVMALTGNGQQAPSQATPQAPPQVQVPASVPAVTQQQPVAPPVAVKPPPNPITNPHQAPGKVIDQQVQQGVQGVGNAANQVFRGLGEYRDPFHTPGRASKPVQKMPKPDLIPKPQKPQLGAKPLKPMTGLS